MTTVKIRYRYDRAKIDAMRASYERAMASMLSWAQRCNTAQEKVKAMHDWLCRHVSYDHAAASASYDPSVSGDHPWTAYGALVRRKCVCQGYTLALRDGLNRLGIAGDYAMTGDHVWNTVKVSGFWYNVDVTSDDPGSGYDATPYDTFFLKSDAFFGHFQHGWETGNGVRCGSATYDVATWKAYPNKSLSGATVTGITSMAYTGRPATQTPVVKVDGRTLRAGSDYTLSYTNNVRAGTATLKVTGRGYYSGTISRTFRITKASNPLVAKAVKRTASVTTLRRKAVTVERPFSVTRAQGTLSYAKADGSAALTVNRATGKVTVKRGTRKGAYTIKVKVTAAGDANHRSASRTVTTRVIVK